MDSFFEFWVKPVLDVPLVEFDSDRPGRRASAQNLVGHKEAEARELPCSCGRRVLVICPNVAEPTVLPGWLKFGWLKMLC